MTGIVADGHEEAAELNNLRAGETGQYLCMLDYAIRDTVLYNA